MNKNLQRLNELITETNKVIENLKQDTEELKANNDEIRTKKYKEIYKTFMECKEIADKLAPCQIWVRTKGEYDDRLAHNTVRLFCDEEISEKGIYIIFNKYSRRSRNTSDDILMASGKAICDNYTSYRVRSEYKSDIYDKKTYDSMVDNWDREYFETEFMKHVEKIIAKKAEEANAEYCKAAESQNKLREEK